MTNQDSQKPYFNWMKFRPLYFILSASVLLIGLVSFVQWNFNLGVEFTGGTNVEYSFESPVETEQISKSLEEKDIRPTSVQKTGDSKIYILKFGEVNEEQKETINNSLKAIGGEKSALLRFEQVGPAISGELLRKTAYAIFISTFVILAWIAYQFKSVKFGISATIATFHDAFIVLGLFSLLGHFFNAEVDYLFVTALLTILSFSVHDTIVVYDRIREIRRKHGGSVAEVANRALSETMKRSLFNSFTILIMLIALVVLGGNTIRWFAVALMIGTISGTYSSPFVAVPVLVTWEQIQKRRQK